MAKRFEKPRLGACSPALGPDGRLAGPRRSRPAPAAVPRASRSVGAARSSRARRWQTRYFASLRSKKSSRSCPQNGSPSQTYQGTPNTCASIACAVMASRRAAMSGAAGPLGQRRSVEAGVAGKLRERRRVGDVALAGPAAAQRRTREVQCRLRAVLGGRHDPPVGEVGPRRRESGLEVERQAEEIAPAGQFDQAVGLSLRRALGQRQAAADREHLAEVDRQHVDGRAVARGDRDEAVVAEVGPRRHRGEVVIDGCAVVGILASEADSELEVPASFRGTATFFSRTYCGRPS